MEGNMMLILPVGFPILTGILVLTGKCFRENRRLLTEVVLAGLLVSGLLTAAVLFAGGDLRLWQLTGDTAVAFQIDGISRLFAGLTVSMWLLVGCYGILYMTHEADGHRFFGFYLIVLGVLLALDFSANLITFYVCYELMTLTSLPLVLNERTKEAVTAGLKYLFYSIAGAFLALFGIFFLTVMCGDLTFTPGGILNETVFSGFVLMFF